jgi:hypothetical protein
MDLDEPLVLETSGADRRPSSYGAPLHHRVVTATGRSFHRTGRRGAVSSVPWHRNATSPDRGGTRPVVPSRSSHPHSGRSYCISTPARSRRDACSDASSTSRPGESLTSRLSEDWWPFWRRSSAMVRAVTRRRVIVDRHRVPEQPDDEEAGRDDRQRTRDATAPGARLLERQGGRRYDGERPDVDAVAAAAYLRRASRRPRRGKIGRTTRVFAVRPSQPSACRVYQPAALS